MDVGGAVLWRPRRERGPVLPRQIPAGLREQVADGVCEEANAEVAEHEARDQADAPEEAVPE